MSGHRVVSWWLEHTAETRMWLQQQYSWSRQVAGHRTVSRRFVFVIQCLNDNLFVPATLIIVPTWSRPSQWDHPSSPPEKWKTGWSKLSSRPGKTGMKPSPTWQQSLIWNVNCSDTCTEKIKLFLLLTCQNHQITFHCWSMRHKQSQKVLNT